MHLAFLSNEFPPEPHGGIGSFTVEMARALTSNGHRVSVIGFGNGPARSEDGGLSLYRLPFPQRGAAPSIRARIQLHRFLERLYRNDPFDVLETPDFEGLLPLPFDHCPTVVRLHHAQSLLRPSLRSRVGPFEEQTLLHHRHWLAVSDHVLQQTTHYFELHPAASEVIPPPVCLERITDEDRTAGPLPRKFVLVSGPLTEEKGAARLANLAPSWLQTDPELFLIHTGSAERPMTRIVEAACGEDAHRMAWLGWMPRSRFHYLLSQAEALITLSTKESFGITTAEASLSGCPVLSPRIPPFSDFYTDELIWYDPDHPAPTADLLRDVLSDPDTARQRADQAAIRVRTECAPALAAQRSLAFYERFLPAGIHP